VANDRNVYRLRALRRVIDRLGVANTSVTAYDGANYPRESGEFDKVLVDAPCSCEGTSRKNPEVVHASSVDYFNRLSGTQRALLRQAVRRCRKGGLIVYSTCTYAPEENELVVDDLLEEFGAHALRLLPARIDGLASSPGITRWDGRQLSEELTRTMRLWPHQNDTGGFFVALLEKTAEV
jgi:16S rRNA C967 or C1407 C5-methylase (RsmB/RsmF family)